MDRNHLITKARALKALIPVGLVVAASYMWDLVAKAENLLGVPALLRLVWTTAVGAWPILKWALLAFVAIAIGWREYLIGRSLGKLRLENEALRFKVDELMTDARALSFIDSFNLHEGEVLKAIGDYIESFNDYDKNAATTVTGDLKLASVHARELERKREAIGRTFGVLSSLAESRFQFTERQITEAFAEPRVLGSQPALDPQARIKYSQTWLENERNMWFIKHLKSWLPEKRSWAMQRLGSMRQHPRFSI